MNPIEALDYFRAMRKSPLVIYEFSNSWVVSTHPGGHRKTVISEWALRDRLPQGTVSLTIDFDVTRKFGRSLDPALLEALFQYLGRRQPWIDSTSVILRSNFAGELGVKTNWITGRFKGFKPSLAYAFSVEYAEASFYAPTAAGSEGGDARWVRYHRGTIQEVLDLEQMDALIGRELSGQARTHYIRDKLAAGFPRRQDFWEVFQPNPLYYPDDLRLIFALQRRLVVDSRAILSELPPTLREFYARKVYDAWSLVGRISERRRLRNSDAIRILAQ